MTASKLVLNAASGAAGAGLDIDELFQSDIWVGTDASLSRVSGIDLSGEGGLVFMQARSSNTRTNGHFDPVWFDTVRGHSKQLRTTSTAAETTNNDSLTAFNNNGFTVSNDDLTNKNQEHYSSWTFRKAPKFFDVLTYSGTGSGIKTVSHNLDAAPAMMIIKKTSGTGNWLVWHKDLTNTHDKYLHLNGTNAEQNYDNIWGPNGYSPTSTEFKVQHIANESGTYVAYLFANNNNDGEFGPTADQDIIKVGGYQGQNSAQKITLGFRPQLVMVKGIGSNSAASWFLWDDLRGVSYDGEDFYHQFNSSYNESNGNQIRFESDGFRLDGDIQSTNRSYGSEPNPNYIYMAIRKGPLSKPSSATDVFSVTDMTSTEGTKYTTGFKSDLFISKQKSSSSSWRVIDRAREMGRGRPAISGYANDAYDVAVLRTDTTNSKYDSGQYWSFDNTGFVQDGASVGAGHIGYNWRMAPSYLDIVPYQGNASNRQIVHNLGVVPEMVWVKCFTDSASWFVYHKDLDASNPGTKYMELNNTAAANTSNEIWNGGNYPEGHNASTFNIGSNNNVNKAGEQFVAYLWATSAGVSKVGSYSGNSGTQTIDCGFSNGAKFVWVKRINGGTEWWVLDTVRGIAVGNDNIIAFNKADAEVTNSDFIDPHSSGFTLDTSNADFNVSGGNYIFYAVAT